VDLLSARGIAATGGAEDRGAFVTVVDERAEAWSEALEAARVVTDARGRYLRLCPDVLTTDDELVAAATRSRKLGAGCLDDQADDQDQRDHEDRGKRHAHQDDVLRLEGTASLRIAFPLRMPRKLETTAAITSRKVASRGAGVSSRDRRKASRRSI
jgi:hypothetical protein